MDKLNACAQTVVQDKPVQSTQANQRRHFSPQPDFSQEEAYVTKNAIKVDSLVRYKPLRNAQANLERHLTDKH